MKIKIKKWGNSLALRIPKSLALDTNLKINQFVELSTDEHKEKIIITPIDEQEYSLEQLLAGITKDNIHKEFETGRLVGKEVW